ncbi:hypothetical protein OH491_24995 [Termitidicoccus mucosus]
MKGDDLDAGADDFTQQIEGIERLAAGEPVEAFDDQDTARGDGAGTDLCKEGAQGAVADIAELATGYAQIIEPLVNGQLQDIAGVVVRSGDLAAHGHPQTLLRGGESKIGIGFGTFFRMHGGSGAAEAPMERAP